MGGNGAPGRCRVEGCTFEALVHRSSSPYKGLCAGHRDEAMRHNRRVRLRVPTADKVDWLALSPEARETLRTVAVLITTGVQTNAEIGAALGMTSAEVSRRMRQLREEIRAQAERDGEGATGRPQKGPRNQPKRAEVRSAVGVPDPARTAGKP